MSDAYTGVLAPTDQPQTRTLDELVIRKLCVSAMSNNVYLLTCRATGSQLLIDAADEPERCLSLVAAGGEGLDHLVTSHSHWDHVRALAAVCEALAPITYSGADDAEALPVTPTVRLADADTIQLGQIRLDVIGLRGHTPGSLALAYDDPHGYTHLFTGDSLFPGGLGNTSMPGQDFDSLYADVIERIFARYDDDTWIYPGHGADSTLGVERPNLDEWRRRGW